MVTHMVTAAWGSWHVEQLLRVALPSLLAEDNLPAFAKAHPVRYVITTTRTDAERIRGSSVLQKIASLAEVELRYLDEDDIRDPIETHHRVWAEAVKRARKQRALLLLLPPDVVFSEGAFGNLARLVSAGKRVIYNMYLRAQSETFVPELLDRFGSADGALRVPARKLMEVGLRHIHPLMLCYLIDSQHFPPHAEFLVWNVPGEGVLLRLLARELLLFDPSRFSLNENALLDHVENEDELYVITDSDEFGAISLAPLWKDVSWYRSRNRFDPVKVGLWWLRYDSPANAVVSKHPLRFHVGEVTEEKWRALERESERIVDELANYRELLRIRLGLKLLGFEQAARVLGAAILSSDLTPRWDAREPATFFVPTDRALEQTGRLERLLAQEDRGPLVELLLGHLIR